MQNEILTPVNSLSGLDYATLIGFFVIIVGIGFWAKRSIKSSEDFYVGGGKIPWWLSGISHHVSGYSSVVFVAYAGIAYATGTAIYFWWAINIAVAISIGAVTIVPRWPRLRRVLGIQSVTEYLKVRYNTASQLIVAFSGIIVKLIDVGAKWASIGILLYGFTGLPIWIGIIISSVVSILYLSIGGLVADLLADFAQFIVQVVAGVALFVAVIMHLGSYGVHSLSDLLAKMPADKLVIFNPGRGQGSLSWSLLYLFVIFFSYNGGTWNLAAKYISVKDNVQAKKAAFLSAALYLLWPIVLFFPMWCGQIIFPDMTAKVAEATLYSKLTTTFLPSGLVGLVVASMFAATMSMCNSDVNTISAVLTRDVLPVFKPSIRTLKGSKALLLARFTTIIFTVLTVLVALFRDQFGGVTSLLLTWFAALLGPTAIPLLLGLLPQFKHCDSKAAIASMVAGLSVFVATKTGLQLPADIALIAPLLCSFVVYAGVGYYNKVTNKPVSQTVQTLLEDLSKDA